MKHGTEKNQGIVQLLWIGMNAYILWIVLVQVEEKKKATFLYIMIILQYLNNV